MIAFVQKWCRSWPSLLQDFALNFFLLRGNKKILWDCSSFVMQCVKFFWNRVLSSEGEMGRDWRCFNTSSKAKMFNSLCPPTNHLKKKKTFSSSCSINNTASSKCQIASVFPSSQIFSTPVWNIRSSDLSSYPRIFRSKLLLAITQNLFLKKKGLKQLLLHITNALRVPVML